MSGIYCIENSINGKKYIGKDIAIDTRWRSHKSKLKRNIHGNVYLQRSWNKYGEENFKYYVVSVCKKESLSQQEMHYIKKWNTKVPNGYNLTDGGEGMLNPSDSTRKKLSLSHSGENHWFFGKHHSEETKKIISEAGKNISDETRTKMSDSKSGTKKKNSTSKFISVSYNSKKNYFFSQFRYNKKDIFVGTFENEISAAKAYDKYVVENKLNRKLNFPEDYK